MRTMLAKLQERETMSEDPGRSDSGMDAPATVGEVTIALRGIRQGNNEATEDLFRLVRQELVDKATKLLRGHRVVQSMEEADDIVNELWHRLSRALLPCDPRNSREFFRVANHKMQMLLIDLSRKYSGPAARVLRVSPRTLPDIGGKGPGWSNAPPKPGVVTWIGDTEEVHLLLMAIARLNDEDRELVQLSYFQELTAPEIAGILGKSEKTVDRDLAKVRQKIAMLMKEIFAQPEEDEDDQPT